MDQMTRKAAFIGLLAVIWSGCTASSTAPSLPPVVDQEFAPSAVTDGNFHMALVGLAQTFTVATSGGRLTGADVWISGEPYDTAQRPPSVSSDILVQIRSTAGGLPTQTVLTSGSIPQAMVPAYPYSGSLSVTHVDFTPQPIVTSGQLLGLTLPATVNAVWFGSVDCPAGAGGPCHGFPRGQGLSFDPTRSSWVNTGSSLFFRTYITK
jgi:hypothetical protein